MPNQRKAGSKLIGVYVPGEQHAKLSRAARSRGITVSDLLRELLAEFAGRTKADEPGKQAAKGKSGTASNGAFAVDGALLEFGRGVCLEFGQVVFLQTVGKSLDHAGLDHVRASGTRGPAAAADDQSDGYAHRTSLPWLCWDAAIPRTAGTEAELWGVN